MTLKSYFPDSEGKYGIETNNDHVPLLVFRLPFHENVY